MNKLKFWLYNIITVFYLSIFVFQYSYAGEVSVQVEVQCSESFMTAVQAPWKRYDGIPGVQYSLTTLGLLKDGVPDVIQVYKNGLKNVTKDGLFVGVEARCVSMNFGSGSFGVNVSSSGSSITCDESDGIEIKMYTPNDADPNKYRYTGVLTMVKEDDDEVLPSVDTIASEISSIKLSFIPTLMESGIGVKIF